MASHIDESKLLDLIEGELDNASASALRGQLADDPQMLASLARLEGDRHELRSLPEPELPHNFRAQLEALLARPMLIEAERPGVYRRQQRRIHRQKRLRQLATAASIALIAAAGIWMAATMAAPQITGAIRSAWLAERKGSGSDAADDRLASNSKTSEPNSPASTISAVELAAITKSDDVVHHYLPQPVPMGEFVVDQPGVPRKNDSSPQPTLVAGKTIAAPFEIVVQSRDAAGIEQVMVALIRETSRSAGLVRNFSYAEAQRIEEEWRVANAGNREDSTPAMADAGRGPATGVASPTKVLAHRVRERMVERGTSNSAEIKASGLVIGLPQNAPTLEQQLEFSSRGATHTVMVPASELASLLGRLGQSTEQASWLRMIDGESKSTVRRDASPAAPTVSDWMQQMPQMRSAVERLMRESADSMILVPVVVETQK